MWLEDPEEEIDLESLVGDVEESEHPPAAGHWDKVWGEIEARLRQYFHGQDVLYMSLVFMYRFIFRTSYVLESWKVRAD